MPLIVANLTNALISQFISNNQTIQSASQGIAQAYAVYASVGQGPNGEPIILTGSEQLILEQYLIRAFRQDDRNQTVQLIGQGITSFWLMPPVTTSLGGICSIVITAGGQSLLLSSRAQTRQQGARNFAQALHVMTQTVLFIETSPLLSGPII